MTAGEIIKNLRGKKTQEELARDLNISDSALSAYEQNTRIPRDDVKIRIANYFGKTVQEIFFTSE